MKGCHLESLTSPYTPTNPEQHRRESKTPEASYTVKFCAEHPAVSSRMLASSPAVCKIKRGAQEKMRGRRRVRKTRSPGYEELILPNQKEETDSLERRRGARKKERSYQPGASWLRGDVKTVETQGFLHHASPSPRRLAHLVRRPTLAQRKG